MSHNGDQIIVFLATLYEQVLAVDEVIGCDHLVECGKFLLVQRYATALYELAHLTLACEHFGLVAGKDFHGRLVQFVFGQREVRNAGENIEQRGFVELVALPKRILDAAIAISRSSRE